ncbi:hypothetical protein L1286_16735 [Pseudoalteromonas sp. SMS1]|nr:hypothetical protein [Pseudoalteromonas sp. SMS1]
MSANFYLNQFLGDALYNSTKAYYVTIIAEKTGSPGFGLAKGGLTVFGTSSEGLG